MPLPLYGSGGRFARTSAAKTLCSASTVEKGFEGNGGNCEAAAKIGKLIGERAVAAGITEVVFDRGGNVYHGRVKALAEGARVDDLGINVVFAAEHAQTRSLGRAGDLAAHSLVTANALRFRIRSLNHSGTPPITSRRSCLLCGGYARNRT